MNQPLRNGIYKKKEFHGRGTKVVNMGELFGFPRIGTIPMKRVELTGTEPKRFSVEKNDLLFARRSLVAEGAGKCSIVMEVDEATTFESSIIRARLNTDRAIPLFYYYYFSSPQGLRNLDTIRRQVAVAGITGGDLADLIVPQPTLQEQLAVTAILGILDDKVELNRRMNETLEAMARAIFKDWFIDFGPTRAKAAGREPYLAPDLWALFPDTLDGTGEPFGWSRQPINKFAKVVYGAAFASKHFNSDKRGVPLIRIRDLATHDPKVFTEEIHKKGHLVEPGDIVVGMDGEFSLQIWKGPRAWLNQRVCHFETMSGALTSFLAEALKDPLAFFERGKVGTTVIHLGKADIDTIRIIDPGTQVLQAFSSIVQPLVDMGVANAAQSSSLMETRNLLLPELMSGAVCLQDAERVVEVAK